jgi:sirohydrochlorin cobaltochelatase
MVIFIAHGSRDPKWRASVEAVIEALQAELGGARVRLAYMDHAPPTLRETAAAAIRDGATRLLVAPLFLAEQGHVSSHILPMVEELRSVHPGVDTTLLPPLTAQPGFRELLREIVVRALH